MGQRAFFTGSLEIVAIIMEARIFLEMVYERSKASNRPRNNASRRITIFNGKPAAGKEQGYTRDASRWTRNEFSHFPQRASNLKRCTMKSAREKMIRCDRSARSDERDYSKSRRVPRVSLLSKCFGIERECTRRE